MKRGILTLGIAGLILSGCGDPAPTPSPIAAECLSEVEQADGVVEVRSDGEVPWPDELAGGEQTIPDCWGVARWDPNGFVAEWEQDPKKVADAIASHLETRGFTAEQGSDRLIWLGDGRRVSMGGLPDRLVLAAVDV